MEILGIISLVAALVGVISLVVTTFRAGFIWGLGVIMTAGLILPFYVLKHWKDARDSVLLIAGSLFVFAWSAYADPAWVFQMRDTLKKELVDETRGLPLPQLPAGADSNSATPGQSATGSQRAPAADPELSQARESLQKAIQQKKITSAPPPEVLEHMKAVKQTSKEVYTRFPIDQAVDHVGKYVRVTDENGVVHEAILKELRGPVLALEKEFAAGGKAVFEIKKRNIKTFEVLVQSLPALPGKSSSP